ncbi:MAG: DUF309 domain-containing protein [Fibrobacterales bacterium]
MSRYTTTPFPPKYDDHRIEPHPEIKRAIKAIDESLGEPTALTNEDFDWRQNKHYLYGVDLFNAGYYWETHELIEGLWRLEARGSQTYDGLKGLIQLAISTLKHDRGEVKGRDMLLINGTNYLLESDMSRFGIDKDSLIDAAQKYQIGEANRPQIVLQDMIKYSLS